MVFILDRSGSMTGLEDDTIGGFNSTIKKQKKEEGEAIVTTVLFDDKYEVLHDRFDIKQVEKMTEEQYYTRGATALLDAMGSAIQKTINVQRHLPEDERAEHVIFVIMTDGYENSSCEYSYSDIKRMVKKEQEKYGWEFMFLGANIDAIEEGGRLGIRANRSVNYVHDGMGTQLAHGAVSKAICAKRKNYEDLDECFVEVQADYIARSPKKKGH